MSGIVAIWNPASGSAPDESELRAALPSGTELVETSPDDPGDGQARAAIEHGAEIVVACGGDGTVRAVLDALAHTSTSLGIVPLGTGNLLASNIGITSGLAGAEMVRTGTPQRIDMGRVNGEAFSVMAGSGFDALMIGEADDRAKSLLGTAAYVWSGARNLRTERVETRVWIDDRLWFEGPTSMVLVGNFGAISGGIEVFPAANPRDGVLDVTVMGATGLRQWASVGWHLFRGRRPRPELARRAQGKEIVVEHDVARVYELDGEDRDPVSRLEFSIDPDALSVIGPAEEGASS
jgi:diacylglycerol kinase family enzyme